MFFWPHLIWKACLFPIGRSCINNNVNLSSDNYTFLNYIPKLHLHLHFHLNIRPDVNNCHSVGLFNVLISERAFILKAISHLLSIFQLILLIRNRLGSENWTLHGKRKRDLWCLQRVGKLLYFDVRFLFGITYTFHAHQDRKCAYRIHFDVDFKIVCLI